MKRGARGTSDERFDRRVLKGGTECWKWTGARVPRGYGIHAAVPGREGRYYAHRYAYLRWVGPIPQGQMVLHRCDNPSCVNPDHLFLGTQTDNMRDCAAKGRVKNQTGLVAPRGQSLFRVAR